MIYFKTCTFEDVDKEKAEAAIRKFSAKRNTSLDILSSSSDVGSEKLFLGLENKNSICITRIRTSFERLLPKMIIRFDKTMGYNQYKIRLSLLSSFVFAFVSISIILNIIYSLNNKRIESDLSRVISFFLIFLALILVEFRLTKSALKSAISKVTIEQP